MAVRRQRTLFVDGDAAVAIEAVRARFNPRQRALIACHVTLCREDELGEHEPTGAGPLTLQFGRPVRFCDGRGVLLPATGGLEAFHALRARVLGGAARPHEPHITLMHPRTSACDDAAFVALCRMPLPAAITFRRAALIEQVDGGPWAILRDEAL